MLINSWSFSLLLLLFSSLLIIVVIMILMIMLMLMREDAGEGLSLDRPPDTHQMLREDERMKERERKERNTKMQWRGEAWNKKERSCQGINTRNYISIKFLYRRPVRGALCVSGAEDEDEKKDHKEDHKKEEEEGGGMMCQMPVSFSQFYLDCALLFCQTSLSYSSCPFSLWF